MKNSKAAEILFAQAKTLLNESILLIQKYNTIADALTEMGYVEAVDFEVSSGVPVPALGLSSGYMDYPDSGFLDEIRTVGPIRKPKAETISGRRFVVASERHRLGEASGWRCFYCGRQGDEDRGPDRRWWHVDHCYPVVRGGDARSDNLVLSCASCNLEKKDKSAAEYFSQLTQRDNRLPGELVNDLPVNS